jgi:N-acyl amino acid synthase of PEP-CTERM/exosortase system
MLDHYKKYFYTKVADTPELKKMAYQLRYQVYADKYGDDVFKGEKNKIETDQYDEHALHGLLFHRPSNTLIGCIRIVPFNKNHHDHLPLEKITRNFDPELLLLSDLRVPWTGEVSRMAIKPSFRRRTYDIYFQLRDNVSGGITNKRLKINYLPLCLLLIGLNLCKEADLDYSVALIEPRLAKLSSMFGIQLTKAGEIIEFHGKRAPYKIFHDASYNHFRPEVQQLYHIIGKELNVTHTVPQWPVLDPVQQPNYRNAGKNEYLPLAMHT